MPKLKLEVDALRVESFHTAAAGQPRGTVNGNAVAGARCGTDAPDCDPITCGPSCIGACTSDGAQAAAGGSVVVIEPASDNQWCTNESYQQTCMLYTCGGCTTEDPQYC